MRVVIRSGRIRAAAGAAMLALAATLSACATGLGASDYSRARVGDVNRVEAGVVVSSRQVRLEGTKSGVGTATGAAIGGLGGSQIGGGDVERAAAGVAGAVIGGLIGAAVEEGSTRQVGYTYTIELERTGELISITQGGDFVIGNGTPVWVEYGSRARVVPRNTNVAG